MPRAAATSCMTTVLTSVSMRLVAARTLAWALLIGGWLVLGTLGHLLLPFRAGGLVPVALWLGVAGVALQCGRSVLLSAERLREVVAIAGFASAIALAWAANGGGTVAILSASIGWGILLVAASRTVRMMRAYTHRVPPPVVPAAAGATLAWLVAGDLPNGPTLGTASWLVATAALLAILLPPRGAGRGCRTGLFDCALPVGAWTQWRDPAAWVTQSARWAMLPMMASLTVMAQWCSNDAGLTPSQTGGLHLCAMLLPPLALRLLRVKLRSTAAAAVAMVAGSAIAYESPALQGLMAASICHSLAWGLVWFARVSGPPAPCPPATASTWTGALMPAWCVFVLGFAIAGDGPTALRWVHIGLGLLAAVGAAAAVWRSASLKMEKSP